MAATRSIIEGGYHVIAAEQGSWIVVSDEGAGYVGRQRAFTNWMDLTGFLSLQHSAVDAKREPWVADTQEDPQTPASGDL